jgi:hypothetical protein
MLMGFDAARITSADRQWLAYNFGELRAGPMLEQVFLRRILANGVRPDALLIELAPAQFAVNIGLTGETNGLPVGRFTWSEMNRLAGYYDSPLLARGRWLKSRVVLSDSNQQELHDALGIDAPLSNGFTSSADNFGFAPYPVPTPEARAAGIQSHVNRYAPRLADAHLAAGPARAARELAALCRREHLPFTVVLMPEVSSLRNLCPPSFLAEVNGMFADMHREADFELVDAREWIADEGFWDGHHLHIEGAKQLSDRLAAEVLPNLKRRARQTDGQARAQIQSTVTAP